MVGIQLLKIIDGSQKQKPIKIITCFPAADNQIRELEIQEKNEYFWDVVGDAILFSEIETLDCVQREGGTCFLIPGYEQPEGLYYSYSVLQMLFEKSKKRGVWEYLLFDIFDSAPNYKISICEGRNWTERIRKNEENNESSILPKL